MTLGRACAADPVWAAPPLAPPRQSPPHPPQGVEHPSPDFKRWKTHNWWRACDHNSASSSGYSPEPSLTTTSGPTPQAQVLQEPAHVVLVVGPDQGEADRKVGAGRWPKAGYRPQVKFIDAQRPAEALQDQTPMSGQVECRTSWRRQS